MRNVKEIELEGGQPSRDSGQTGLKPDEHGINIVEISPRVKNWFESLKKAEESTQSQWLRIPKAHLHEGEMIKPRYAQKFLADSDQRVEALYTKIGSNIEELRKCYDWSSTKKYDDEELAWVMLLDGCFLLDFIRRVVTGKWSECRGFNVKYRFINFMDQDLFMLENQLPFGVLKLIFEGAKFNYGLTMEKMIQTFITPNNGTQLESEDEEPSHFLDLVQSALLGRYNKIQPKQDQKPEEKEKLCEGGDGGFCCPWKKGKQQGIWYRMSFLTDISFKSYFFCGYLKLPPISIDDFTKTNGFWGVTLNMVAYEMCRDDPYDYAVTSYICFLDELIDHADDVKELRSKHILDNLLGSDEDVAQIFNEIANRLVDHGIYEGVKARIQKIYDRRVNSWIAQALHDHFSTPWTVMTFIAAVLILFLTGVQTYCALPGKSS
ncbi:hypothetical protein PVL29_018533 [Vitis rotundifolia]|uniref:Uncharacterized protein n=1 Tax=Vitis rotundifolia TaxID=103349 RepID=A0AA39DF44_VITRO|nr:hypothetical protein PVL29_018533 [Vitis rotundifolia]